MTVPLAVAVCTLNHADYVARTLDALEAQEIDFPITVIDQSPVEDVALRDRAGASARLTVIRDPGRGLSRARNIAWRSLDAECIAFVDDDCYVQEGWARAVIEGFEHPDVSFVSGAVIEHGAPEGDYVPVTTQEVTEPHLISGTRVHVWSIGFGAMTAVRRSMIEQLGGWDERLGPGSERYPAGDDMDFNYRFLKAGGTAYVTPDARVLHDQWRTPGDLPGLYEGYAVAWSAFAIKHLRTGDLAGGARLWCWGVYDLYRMAGSAVRRHSRVRARIAFRKLIGIAKGTRRGLVERW